MNKFKRQNSNILFSTGDQTNTEVVDYDVLRRHPIHPGCAKIHWHIHSGIQILIAIDGIGYYQEKGKPIQELHKGDVIFILPNVEHWHAADLGSEFTDITVPGFGRNEIVTWLQRAVK